MWKHADRNSNADELRRRTIQESQAADAAGRRTTLRGEQEHDEMNDDDAMQENENTQKFQFDFKSLQRPFQKLLFENHDRLRRDVASLWTARKQFEAVLEEYQKFQETGQAPRFADAFKVPKCVLGMPFPLQDGPAAGKSIQEVIDSFQTAQLATKVDHMVKVKEAVVDHFKAKVSQRSYEESIRKQLDHVVDELRAMALDLDFGYEAWYEEASHFARVSFEHVVFARAANAVRATQTQNKLEERQSRAQAAFTALPKEAQFELMIESKIHSMLGRGRSEPAYRHLCLNPKEQHDLNRALSSFRGEFGLNARRNSRSRQTSASSKGRNKGKGKGKGKNASRPSSKPSQVPNSRKGRGKGMPRARSRTPSNHPRAREHSTKGKGKGKAKGKGKRKGLASAPRSPSWNSRWTNGRATFNPQGRTPYRPLQGRGGGWHGARW